LAGTWGLIKDSKSVFHWQKLYQMAAI